MSDIKKTAQAMLVAEYQNLGIEPQACTLMAQGHQPGGVHHAAVQAITAALTPPEQFPEGWHLSERATCYVLSEGNNIVGNFVGPDAEQNAARVARMLTARPEVR